MKPKNTENIIANFVSLLSKKHIYQVTHQIKFCLDGQRLSKFSLFIQRNKQ